MPATLTVEPEFKSTGVMERLPATWATIGEVAHQVGVAPSTLRYYERRGLLRPDARVSGQRRYRPESVRALLFIGMLQDAGLSLDEIDGIINAATNQEWKAVARRRLTTLDEEIERLTRARAYLSSALQCRSDHPLTECRIMGREIDRRLTVPAPNAEPAPDP